MLLSQKSLTRTTLITMSIRIALVIIVVTLVSYWYVIAMLESQTVEQLRKYIIERGHRESSLFQLAGDNQAIFKQELLARYQAMGHQDPLAQFEQLFEKTHGDLTKMRADYFTGSVQANGLTIRGVFGSFPQTMTLTPALRRLSVIAVDLLSQYGPAWRSRFFDMYVFTPEELFLGYWPEVLWYPETTSGYKMSQQEWFYLADLQHNPRRQTTWTGAYYDEVSKIWLISCVTPLDVEGKHLLSMGNDIKLSDLFERTIKNHLEGTSNLIFRADGRLIAHPDYMEAIQKKGGLFDMRRDGDAHLRHLFELVSPRQPEPVVVENATHNELLAITRIEGPDWYLVTVYPKSLLTGMAFRTARFILILGILALLLEVTILFFVLRKQVTQPLTQFLEATQRIAAGNFEIQLDIARPDELGWLAQSFNARSQTLEGESMKRTKELAAQNSLLEQTLKTTQSTEQTLRESQALLQGLLDHAPFLIFVKNTQGQLILCNRQLELFFNLRKEQLLGKTEFDLLPKKIATHNWQTDLEVLATGKPIEHEEIAVSLGGTLQTYLAIKFPLFDAAGEPYAVCGMATDITERKQVEQALHENEKRYRILFEESPVSLWEEDFSEVKRAVDKLRAAGVTDFKTYFKNHPEVVANFIPLVKVIDINKATLEMYQATSKEQLLGNLSRVVVNAVAVFGEELAAIADHQTEFSMEATNLTLKGEEKQVLFKFSVVPGFENTYSKVLVSLFDVTERKQAEQLLQDYNQRLEYEIAERTSKLCENEERFELALRGANDGLWDWNIEINRAYLSPRYRQILDIPAAHEWFSVEEFTQTIHLEDVEQVKAALQAYLDKRTPSYEVTYRAQHSQGHFVWLLSRGVAVWDEQDQPVRMVGTIMDITVQKQAEEKLQAALNHLNQFKMTLDVTLDSVFMFDADTLQFFYVNQGAVNQLDYTQEELLQMTVLDLNPTSSFAGEEYTEAVMMLLVENAQKPALTFETIHQHKQGHWIPVEVFAQCIQLSEETKYFIAIARDITEHKQAEAKLQQAKSAAEEAKQAAEIANQAKSAFLANMSHELRTPLNGILGYAQILGRDKGLTAKQKEGIGIIQRSGEYLLTLINDVLDLSKIEAGRVELFPTDFNFLTFLQGLRELFQMRAEQKGIAFIFEPLSHLPRGVRTDEKRLRQVLINLLGNAVKFTERGGVTLKVGYEPNGKMRFQVEDTGVGIAFEELETIFLPFQQVGHQNYRAEGTGLGLSITKKLVAMMGGELQVASQLGQGSTFWIVLNLPETTDLVKSKDSEPPVIIGVQGPPRKILVVDDKWENRSVLTHLLTPLGFEIKEANHGQEGLELVHRWQPALILIDLVMPVMDGFEFTRQLRKLPVFKNLPVIAVSASVFDWHQQESLAAGCNDFVAKPVRAEVLLESLQKHLGLTWIYEQQEPSASGVEVGKGPAESSTPLVGPSPEQAAILFDLAMMGDISGILEEIEKLEQVDNQLVPFVRKVRKLAKNFEERRLCELLQLYIVTD